MDRGRRIQWKRGRTTIKKGIKEKKIEKLKIKICNLFRKDKLREIDMESDRDLFIKKEIDIEG